MAQHHPTFDPYTPLKLYGYDAAVCGLSNHWIWRCPTREIRALYHRLTTDNHLDVGVGTGYFLARCRFPARPRLVLLDLNRPCLDHAARRLRHLQPACVQANVLEPLPALAPFESISLTYLLHCLPGSMADKAVVFDHLAPLLAAAGVLFGATVLNAAARPNRLARGLQAKYNRAGVFCNREDDLPGLETALAQRFTRYQVRTVGYVALFSAFKSSANSPSGT